MPRISDRPRSTESLEGLSSPTPEQIRDELQAILASPSFQGSKRCQGFLSYVCEKSLLGEASELKERTIAIEVFSRPAHSDLGGGHHRPGRGAGSPKTTCPVLRDGRRRCLERSHRFSPRILRSGVSFSSGGETRGCRSPSGSGTTSGICSLTDCGASGLLLASLLANSGLRDASCWRALLP